jgi:hypothetical protein
VFAFVDFQKYGITEILGAGETKSPHKGYQESSDGIYIFQNFQQVAVVKSRSEAATLLRKLITACPPEARKDFEQFGEYLFRSII